MVVRRGERPIDVTSLTVSDRIGPGGDGYSKTFYNAIAGGSGRSAEIVLPLVFEIGKPTSVVDVGCGVGAWLRAAKSLGVDEVLGLDGDHVPVDLLEIEQTEFRAADLSKPLPHVGHRFELAISLEVAEHLPLERADRFVADLCALADMVLFSAAVPYQGGQDHINEQWPSQWAQRFASHGYVPFDVVRPVVWANPEVEVWYQQNMLLFVAQSRADLIASSQAATATAAHRTDMLDVVHPASWERLSRMSQGEPSLRHALSLTSRAARRSLQVRVDRLKRR